MRQVLVTGATGLIGAHVAAGLSAYGCSIRTVGRRPAGCSSELLCDHVQADVLTLDDQGFDALVGGCDTLVHMAWETEHGRFWHAAENLDWVAASVRLLRAFARGGGRRFVAAGTCAEYEAPAAGPCIPGVTPVKPGHLYGVAKDSFHRLLAQYAEESELQYVWARIFHVIGPAEPPARLVPSIVDAILAGRRVACSSGRQIRDFMDVRDYGEAFARLAASEQSGVFNICSGQPVTIAHVAMTIGRMLGGEQLVALGARPDSPDEPRNLWGDTEALRQATGFVPRYDLEAMLQNAMDHSQERTEKLTMTEGS